MESMLFGEEELDGAGGGTYELQRVKEDKYIDNYFEKDTVDNTKSHIFLNSTKIATANNNDNPYYILGDHLGSSSILTDNSGNIAELSDYQPFGKISYEDKLIDLKDDYQFTGQEYDDETDLQYYGARYMDNEIGRFISIDPVLVKLHDSQELSRITSQDITMFLADPQKLNSYSYTYNNPIVMVDGTGESGSPFPYSLAAKSNPITFFVGTAFSGAMATYYWVKSVEAYGTGDTTMGDAYSDAVMLSLAGVGVNATAMLQSMEAKDAARQAATNNNNVISGQKITSSSQVPKNVSNQMSKEWGSGQQSKSGTGWVWTDPANKNNEVRYMSGDPASQYANSQNPYMVVSKDVNGQRVYFNAYGEAGIRRSAETHFDPSEFDINNYNF